MGSDLIYGQNDSFVLAWIVLSLWLWFRVARGGPGGAGCGPRPRPSGLACASKPTAWFLAPFYLLLVAGGDPADLWRRPLAWAGSRLAGGLARAGGHRLGHRAVSHLESGRHDRRCVALVKRHFRTRRIRSGGGARRTCVLAFGWVRSRFDYWPFWLPQLVIGLPLLLALSGAKRAKTRPARACGATVCSCWLSFSSRAFSTRTISAISWPVWRSARWLKGRVRP